MPQCLGYVYVHNRFNGIAMDVTVECAHLREREGQGGGKEKGECEEGQEDGAWCWVMPQCVCTYTDVRVEGSCLNVYVHIPMLCGGAYRGGLYVHMYICTYTDICVRWSKDIIHRREGGMGVPRWSILQGVL